MNGGWYPTFAIETMAASYNWLIAVQVVEWTMIYIIISVLLLFQRLFVFLSVHLAKRVNISPAAIFFIFVIFLLSPLSPIPSTTFPTHFLSHYDLMIFEINSSMLNSTWIVQVPIQKNFWIIIKSGNSFCILKGIEIYWMLFLVCYKCSNCSLMPGTVDVKL